MCVVIVCVYVRLCVNEYGVRCVVCSSRLVSWYVSGMNHGSQCLQRKVAVGVT